MPLKSLQIKKTCPECGKTLEEVSSKVVEGVRIVKTVCGHLLFEKNLVTNEEDLSSFTSQDGRKLRPFQVRRVKDVENSNGRALLNQEMGLGKTVIAASLFKLHYNEMVPILIVCKAGLKHQMFWEMNRWIGNYVPDENGKLQWEGTISQVIDGTKEKPVLKFFKVVIVSFETLAQAKWVDEEEFQGAFKTVFIDECQKIKNPEAKMTKAVRKLCSGKIVRKRVTSDSLGDDKVQMIVNDLMTYHGIKDRFSVSYENLYGDYGRTEVKCNKDDDGIITGQITLDKEHCINGSKDEVIDTILHEIAHALTPGGNHSRIWRETAESIGARPEAKGKCDGTTEIKETQEIPQYIIAASGTPIKNNAAEYFTILNILRPDKFWNKADFERRYVDQVWDGYKFKSGGIKKHMMIHFQEATKDFIFRDTRIEVEPDLPLVDRQWRYSELGEEVQKAYDSTVEDFNNEFGDSEFGGISLADRGNVLAYINKMRQIVGMSKVAPCVDYLEDFLEETENEKIVVFVHHINTGNVLNSRMKAICEEKGYGKPLTLTSDLNSEQRAEVVDKFREDNNSRLLIASTLAAGEGLNLQFASHCVMMERQWNPANEEQSEARFTRIGSQAKSVIAMYLVAVGTIDEYFAELVEKKRNYMSSALDGKEIAWDESDILKGLFEKLKNSGKNKWKLAK